MQICSAAPPNVLRLALCLVYCVVLSVFSAGCDGCSAEHTIATIIKKSGAVDRSTVSANDKWTDADVGSEMALGDAVRTRKSSGAELSLDDGSLLSLDEETVIRFLDKEPVSGEQSFDLELGAASIEAPEAGTSIRTVFGLARLEGGTKVQLRRRGDALRYEVLVGSAKLESSTGEQLTVEAGQRVEVTVGQASLELMDDDAPVVAPASASETTDEDLRKNAGPIVATVKGSKVAVQAPGSDSYQALSTGKTTIASGTTIKVGKNSSVVVSQGSEKAELATGGTYVVGGDQLVSAISGSVTVTAEGMMRVVVPGGVIVTRAGSATISTQPKVTRVQARSGSVSLQGTNQDTLSGGEVGLISSEGEVSVEGRGIDKTDLRISAGQSLVVHDPAPPTAVRFVFGQLCEAGLIRLKAPSTALPSGAQARGVKDVALYIGPSTAKYTLHCVDNTGKESEVKASGSITVLHDAGSRSMPKKAPSTTIDVNGRGYTVMYQNQLPKVTLRWSGAPQEASGFKLHVSGAGRSRTLSTNSASYTFASGGLGTGTHTVYFTGGGRVSRRSTVRISFDNATPTASLSTPVNIGAGPGGLVTVSGSALPGWSASVDGKALGQDSNNRFTMKTPMPSDGRALAVHLTHPGRGSHVYLRRPTGGK